MAMDIFWLTRKFLKEKVYSLTSQITRSNIVGGWAKRKFESVFKQHLVTSLASNAETENRLKFAIEYNFIQEEEFETLAVQINEIGKMLNSFHLIWKSYEK